jgi:hypothetical protein
MGMPEFTTDMSGMAGSSPKNIQAIAILRIYEKYWDQMATNENFQIDRATAATIITCPDAKQRDEMWKFYTAQRDKTNAVDASVLAVGMWYSFMADSMGLNEKSTAGW